MKIIDKIDKFDTLLSSVKYVPENSKDIINDVEKHKDEQLITEFRKLTNALWEFDKANMPLSPMVLTWIFSRALIRKKIYEKKL